MNDEEIRARLLQLLESHPEFRPSVTTTEHLDRLIPYVAGALTAFLEAERSILIERERAVRIVRRELVLPRTVMETPIRSSTLSVGTITLHRDPVARTFLCGRCHEPKTSKLHGTWATRDGVTITICNGCFGNLSATDD